MRKVMAFFANYKPTMSFDELTGIPTFSGSILICMGVYIPHRLSTALQGRAPCPSATNVYALTNPAHWPYWVRTAPNHPYPPLQSVKSFTHTNRHRPIRLTDKLGTSKTS